MNHLRKKFLKKQFQQGLESEQTLRDYVFEIEQYDKFMICANIDISQILKSQEEDQSDFSIEDGQLDVSETCEIPETDEDKLGNVALFIPAANSDDDDY